MFIVKVAIGCAWIFTIGIFPVFIKAYQSAPTNFVAPFEYSAMIYALIYGVFLFHDYPDGWTLAGAGIVIAAGLSMLWRDSRLPQTIG